MTLETYRDQRAFREEDWLQKKSQLIMRYLTASKIDAVVVGVSGGVDSALVVYLLSYIMGLPNSPLKRVMGVIAPVTGSEGATGQGGATARAIEVCQRAFIEHVVWDMGPTQATYKTLGDKATHVNNTPWAQGQCLSIIRTPVFYYMAALMQEEGSRSVVCGTTNRDEGSYIGFYGKASDGMCDIQPISDLHKSEVYQVARYLGVPESVLNETPKGDVWDGRVDKQMIGAPYWYVEYFTGYILPHSPPHATIHTIPAQYLDPDTQIYAENILKLHAQNAHKYLVGSPAVHFDVMDRYVPNGWSARNSYTYEMFTF